MDQDQTEEIEESSTGPFHDFWLVREGETDYYDFWKLLGRKDAPVRLSDYLLGYLMQTLQWVPTINPRKNGKSERQFGLNRYGPTIIASIGGECLRQICLGWQQILAQGPEPLVLPSDWLYCVEEGPPALWKPRLVRTSRQALLLDLHQLAEFGERAASGEYYLLHLGI